MKWSEIYWTLIIVAFPVVYLFYELAKHKAAKTRRAEQEAMLQAKRIADAMLRTEIQGRHWANRDYLDALEERDKK